MRERVTFLHDPEGAPFDPKQQLRVGKSSLQVEKLSAAREGKFTLEVEELPQEV
jgi:hypothetical protein